MRATISVAAWCCVTATVGCSEAPVAHDRTAHTTPEREAESSEARLPQTELQATTESTAVVDPRSSDATDVAVFVLQWMLRGADPNEVYFISTGRMGDGWIDPTPAVMERLNGLGLTLRPASDARLPKSGEMESENRLRGVEDPRTGKRCDIYHVSIIEWSDDTTAEVIFGEYGGPLASSGGSLVVEKKDGNWTIKEHTGNWVS